MLPGYARKQGECLPDATATQLKGPGQRYRIDAAVDYFYSDDAAMINAERAANASAKAGDKTVPKLEAQFNSYKGAETGFSAGRLLRSRGTCRTDPDHASQTDIDGSFRYIADLSLNPEDVSVICLAHLLRAPRMGVFDRKGWIEGWKAVGLRPGAGGDLVGPQAAKVKELDGQLRRDADYFGSVYRFAFEWGREEGQKSLGPSPALPPGRCLMLRGGQRWRRR